MIEECREQAKRQTGRLTGVQKALGTERAGDEIVVGKDVPGRGHKAQTSRAHVGPRLPHGELLFPL